MTARTGIGRRLVAASSLRVLSFLIDLVTAFFLMPFLIHHLGEARFGVWALIGTIASQAWMLDFGLSSTAERYMAQALARADRTEAIKIFSTALALFAALGGLVMIAILAVAAAAPIFFAGGDEQQQFIWALATGGGAIALSFPFNVLVGTLAANLRYDLTTKLQMAKTLVRVATTVLFIELGWDIVGLGCSQLLVAVLDGGVLVLLTGSALPWLRPARPLIKWGMAKELITFSKFTFMVKLGDTARYRCDNFIVAGFLGLTAVTHYSVVIRFADYFGTLILSVFSLAGPVFARYHAIDDMTSLRQNYLSLSALCALTTGIIAGIILTFSSLFITLWLGPGYHDSYLATTVMVVGMTCSLIQSPSRDVLGAIYKHPFDAYTSLCEAVVNIGISILLVERLGLVGVALGTTLPMVVNKLFILPTYVCRTIDLSIWRYYRTIGRPLLVVAVGHLPLILLARQLPSSWTALILLFFGYYAMFCPIAFRLGVAGAERSLVLNTLRRRRNAPG